MTIKVECWPCGYIWEEPDMAAAQRAVARIEADSRNRACRPRIVQHES